MQEFFSIFVCLWSDVPQTLTSGVSHECKQIFLPALFSEKCIENFLLIENGDFQVFFKTYLLPQFSNLKAAIFAFSSSLVFLTNYEKVFRCVIKFLRYFNFWLFFPKKSIINWPVLYAWNKKNISDSIETKKFITLHLL